MMTLPRIIAKEVSIFTSDGTCGSITNIYQPKEGDLRLVKRLMQNMKDDNIYLIED